MKLENRTFIVSGGASGLGLATVQELVKAGAYISIFDVADAPDIDDRRVLFIKTDISKLDEVEAAIETTMGWTHKTGAIFGGVINSAGIGTPELTVNTKGEPHSVERWNKLLAVNLSGTFHLTRLALKHLVSATREEGPDGERGVILMVSSTAASEGQPGQVAYAATKGAIESMTLPMARDLARHSIRVVTIAPGPFATPLTDLFSGKVSAEVHSRGLLYPKRYGYPSEFASTVKWVLETPYVNGETIKLTGGMRIPAYL